MTDDEQLDDLFRERLEQYSQEPPPEVWQGIMFALDQKKTSRRIVLLRWSAVAAMLLVVITTGLWIISTSIPDTSPKLAGEQSAQTPDSSDAKLKGHPIIVPEKLRPENLTAHNPKSSALPKTITASIESARISENSGITRESNQIVSIASLKKIDVVLRTASYDKSLQTRYTRSSFIIKGNSDKDNDREMAVQAGKKERNQISKRGWSVGLRVSPAYSSFASAYTDAYARKLNTTGDQAQASLGGGISVHYVASARWYIESGIQYSQSSDKPGSSHLFSAKADYAATPQSGYKYYNSTLSADNGQLAINSTAGVVQFDKTPVHAELVTVPESTIGLNTALLTSGELSQAFDFIEFPLSIHYQIMNKKPVIDLFSGISTNFLVGNNVFIQNQSGSERVGKTKDISAIS
jgi:hypothetical protein